MLFRVVLWPSAADLQTQHTLLLLGCARAECKVIPGKQPFGNAQQLPRLLLALKGMFGSCCKKMQQVPPERLILRHSRIETALRGACSSAVFIYFAHLCLFSIFSLSVIPL